MSVPADAPVIEPADIASLYGLEDLDPDLYGLPVNEGAPPPKTAPEELPGPRGRRYVRDRLLEEQILDRVAEGESLRTICAVADMPAASTVFGWIRTEPEFARRYQLAVQCRADAGAEELEELKTRLLGQGARMSKEEVAACKAGADILQWKLQRLLPEQFGDRQRIDVGLIERTPEEIDRRLLTFMSRLPVAALVGRAADAEDLVTIEAPVVERRPIPADVQSFSLSPPVTPALAAEQAAARDLASDPQTPQLLDQPLWNR